MSDIGGVFREPGLQTSSSKSNDRVLSFPSPQSSSHLTLKHKLITIFCSNFRNHVETRFRVCNQGTCGHTLQLLKSGSTSSTNCHFTLDNAFRNLGFDFKWEWFYIKWECFDKKWEWVYIKWECFDIKWEWVYIKWEWFYINWKRFYILYQCTRSNRDVCSIMYCTVVSTDLIFYTVVCLYLFV